MRAFKLFFLAAVTLSFTSAAVAGLDSQPWQIWNKSNEYNGAIIDHSLYDGFLKTYVVTNHPLRYQPLSLWGCQSPG